MNYLLHMLLFLAQTIAWHCRGGMRCASISAYLAANSYHFLVRLLSWLLPTECFDGRTIKSARQVVHKMLVVLWLTLKCAQGIDKANPVAWLKSCMISFRRKKFWMLHFIWLAIDPFRARHKLPLRLCCDLAILMLDRKLDWVSRQKVLRNGHLCGQGEFVLGLLHSVACEISSHFCCTLYNGCDSLLSI